MLGEFGCGMAAELVVALGPGVAADVGGLLEVFAVEGEAVEVVEVVEDVAGGVVGGEGVEFAVEVVLVV